MALLSVVKRLVVEDFANVKTFTDYSNRLFYVVNNFFNSVSTAMNNGLTINQNMVGSVTSQSTSSTSATGTATLSIKWPYLGSPPIGVMVVGCTQTSGTQIAANYPLLTWTYTAGVVTANLTFLSFSGTTFSPIASQTFAVTLWITAG